MGEAGLWMACGAWIQVISQLSPQRCLAGVTVFNSVGPLAPAAPNLTQCVETLITSSPTCGFPLILYVDEPMDGLCVAIYIHGSIKLSREIGR